MTISISGDNGANAVGDTATQTLSNKTLVSPVITGTASVATISATGEIANTVWTDYSSTSTVTGWSSYTTKTIKYKRVGNLVFVQFYIDGTSSSTISSFTVPYSIASGFTDFYTGGGLARDNGVFLTSPCGIRIANGVSTISIYRDPSSQTAWVSSGTKTALGQFWYETA